MKPIPKSFSEALCDVISLKVEEEVKELEALEALEALRDSCGITLQPVTMPGSPTSLIQMLFLDKDKLQIQITKVSWHGMLARCSARQLMKKESLQILNGMENMMVLM